MPGLLLHLSCSSLVIFAFLKENCLLNLNYRIIRILIHNKNENNLSFFKNQITSKKDVYVNQFGLPAWAVKMHGKREKGVWKAKKELKGDGEEDGERPLKVKKEKKLKKRAKMEVEEDSDLEIMEVVREKKKIKGEVEFSD